MAKKNIKSLARVFSGSFKMETETVYHEDGHISTYPCAYELGQQITTSGSTVQMKAKVTVDTDGNTQVMPYRKGSGSRYRELFKTKHGVVNETTTDIIVKLQFRKRKGRCEIADMLEDETEEIIEFVENGLSPTSPEVGES